MIDLIKIFLISGVFLIGILAALILSKMTKQEKPIYKNYFPVLLWILAILAAVFYSIDLVVALSLTVIFVIILIWGKL